MALIKPLPHLAATQVQASSLITTLQDVVLGLVANSLDAGATRIDVVVDFETGGCRVEDNGSGIAPADFAADTGLGKLHHTSKWDCDSVQHGGQGIFLWAISSLALVRLVSRQSAQQSPCHMMFHHGAKLPLQGSALDGERLRCRDHGTHVEVRDLFGRMPVRVMQRPCGQAGLRQREKEWRRLLVSLSGMLLAWGQPVDFLCDGNEPSHKVRVRHSNILKLDNAGQTKESGLVDFFRPFVLKAILIHCALVDPLRWTSWVASSARTSQWTVQALISLDPSPSRHIQFISMGIHHIGLLEKLSWLYGAINEIFEYSSFGSLETHDHQHIETVRGKEPRLKISSPTAKQLRNRGKGTERWPMFYLRIDRTPSKQQRTPKIEDEDYSSLFPIIRAMVEGFLREHNIRTWRPRLQNNPSAASVCPPSLGTSHSRDPGEREAAQGISSRHFIGTQAGSTRAKADLRVTSRRMKVGLNAFSSLEITSRNDQLPRSPVQTRSDRAPASLLIGTQHPNNHFPVERLRDSEIAGYHNEESISPSTSSSSEHIAESSGDLNHRSTYFTAHEPSNQHLKLSHSLSEMRAAISETPWATELLTNWSNPVFRSPEPAIHHLSQSGELNEQFSQSTDQTGLTGVSHLLAAPGGMECRLRKVDLFKGTVISQVDGKFILARFSIAGTTGPKDDSQPALNDEPTDLLVLMDQHAIDERVRVESLLADLCQPLPLCFNEFRSSLGHISTVTIEVLDSVIGFELRSPECSLFREHAGHFARWGILYNLRHEAAEPCECMEHSIYILTLPPIIAKRCIAEPRLLLDLLRGEVWALNEGRACPRKHEPDTLLDSPSLWTQLQDCPDGLLELVKSRACRSAIMFNDNLSREECEELVRKVSSCHLPFQCAHGRPSMAPVVNLGALASSWAVESEATTASAGGTGQPDRDFEAAWLAWNASRHTDD